MRAVTVLLALTGAMACGRADRGQFAGELQAIAATMPEWVDRDAPGRRLWAIEKEFYELRAWTPAWIDGDNPTPQLDELLAALKDADLHGLELARYGYHDLAAARAKADDDWIGATFAREEVPELDLRLTYAFLTYAADLLGWRTSPRTIDRNWLASPRTADLLDELRAGLENNRVGDTLDALAPAHPQYTGLQAALARARDETSEEAAVTKIRMNLERWRWLPRDLGDRHILINVPAYQMQVVENGKPVMAMRVIVGAPDTPTPLFSDRMTYVVFSPYWNIPENILRQETLPRVADDPEYLARNNIEVVGTSGEAIDPSSIDWSDAATTEGLRFRQTPGPDNALGLVKFIFPNHFSIYLHDTPTDALFNRDKRTLSHGCIRIEKPVELVEYVLRDKAQWTPERIRAAMHSGREQSVTLSEPLPVHIGYWTAWVDEDGSVTFTDDPYRLDRKQAAVHDYSLDLN